MRGFIRGMLLGLVAMITTDAQAFTEISMDVQTFVEPELFAVLPYEEDDYVGYAQTVRSHHAAVYDVVTEQHHHPFSFTPSPLGDAIRLTSFLLGEIYAAAEEQDVHDHIVAQMHTFSYRVLDLYALYCTAQADIKRQVDQRPEQANYLLGEMGHLRERIAVLLDRFSEEMGAYQNEYVSTVKVTLERIMRKTAFFLGA